jgi:hypothetical protein
LNNHLAVTLLSVQHSSLLLVAHRQDVERNKGTHQALSLVFAPPFSFIPRCDTVHSPVVFVFTFFHSKPHKKFLDLGFASF